MVSMVKRNCWVGPAAWINGRENCSGYGSGYWRRRSKFQQALTGRVRDRVSVVTWLVYYGECTIYGRGRL